MTITTEQKVQLLSESINDMTEKYDQDFMVLSECNISQEFLSNLVESVLLAEIEKLVHAFETFNPNVFIKGVSRYYDEAGDPVVYLDWFEKQNDEGD